VGRTGDGHLRALRFVGVASERRRAPTAVRLSRHASRGEACERDRRAEVERDHILRALEASNWVISGAAARLGMKRTSLAYRMKKLRIRRPAAVPQKGSFGAARDN